jgi:hypothetical protein
MVMSAETHMFPGLAVKVTFDAEFRLHLQVWVHMTGIAILRFESLVAGPTHLPPKQSGLRASEIVKSPPESLVKITERRFDICKWSRCVSASKDALQDAGTKQQKPNSSKPL